MKPVTAIVLLILGIIVAGVVALRFTASPTSRPNEKTNEKKRASQQESGIEAVRDVVRRNGDLEAYRGALQQLNLVLAELPQDDRPRPLPDGQRSFLTAVLGLDDSELGEIGSNSFTLMDAHHLELADVLTDASRSLRLDELPPLERATAAFDWVVRNVKPAERADDLPVPPLFVLRRGWGTSYRRAVVFAALIDQLGLDACILTAPYENQGQKGIRYWIPGVLVDKEIYLFDTRMGIPLPGPAGKGIATLRQVRLQPETLPALTVKAPAQYDVTPAHAKDAEVLVAYSLSAIAPRMAYLQEGLSSSERLPLYTDPLARWDRFKEATAGIGQGKEILKAWSTYGDPNSPLRVLRAFLPREEGGIDDTNRRLMARNALIPEQTMPKPIRGLPGELGQRIGSMYRMPFIYFGAETKMPKEQMQYWLPGLVENQKGEESKTLPDVIQRGRLPRDLALRGRYDEALTILVTIRDELRRQREQVQVPNLEADVQAWCDQAVDSVATLLRAEAAVSAGGTNVAALAKANDQVNRLWGNSGKVRTLVLGAAAGPMLNDVTYLLALCKHEQAVRLQGRLDRTARAGKAPSASDNKAAQAAWSSAAAWWSTYLEGDGSQRGEVPDTAMGKFLQAMAKFNQGEQVAALAVLLDINPKLFPLEHTGRLLLAERWKAAPMKSVLSRGAP